jgi:hypothetical protein
MLLDDGCWRWTLLAIAQHGIKFHFGNSEPVLCWSTWVAGDWWTCCSADVVDSVVTHLALNSSGASEVWKLGENAVDWCTDIDDFDTGDTRIGCLGRCRQRCDATDVCCGSFPLELQVQGWEHFCVLAPKAAMVPTGCGYCAVSVP